MNFSIFEILMLLCFACSWPVSIVKSIRTKVVLGKSPFFMVIIIIGYVMGIIHKVRYSFDWVTWLYAFNMLIVSVDLALYFCFIGKNKRELLEKKNTDNQ